MRPWILTTVFALFVVSSSPLLAEDDQHVRVRLLCDADGVQPGQTVTAGVHLEIDEGWHVYWRNPGGAGMATSVDFSSEQVATAGPLQWPIPIAFDQGGGIPGYGYEGEVVLSAELVLKDENLEEESVLLEADVAWLACKDVCILGEAVLEQRFPLPRVARDKAGAVLDQWGDRLPRAGGETPGLAGKRVTGDWMHDGINGTFSVWLTWSDSPSRVDWFPHPGEALKITDVKVRTRANLTRLDFKLRRLILKESPTVELPSILIIENRSERSGYSELIEIDL
ncbi:MAG: hypothetical protein GY906_27565 [bacterium]|nr:hypothetical protein [bacterium]